MPEQLTMDFDNPATAPPAMQEPTVYEALDYQLAGLLQSLNGKPDRMLEHYTLEISRHTREGQIAVACKREDQEGLLATQVVGEAGEYMPLILDRGYLYLNRYWHYQQQLADQIRLRLVRQGQSEFDGNGFTDRLDHYFGNSASSETDWQKTAAQRALQHHFLILSGGPGTGKTTTITRILALLIEQNLSQGNTQRPLRIKLAAPTGKAAIRMLDSIRNEQKKLNLDENILALMPNHATTLHKLLGYIPKSIQFKHNHNNPLNADVVLIDEASMVDIAMMSKLLEAVPKDARLILIGDKDQLSSVETGSVFADLCEGFTGSHHLITLQKNWRFAKDSGIGQLAIAANKGDSNSVLAVLKDESKPECSLLSSDLISPGRLPVDLIAPWGNYFDALNNKDASIAEIFEAFNQYRVLCALRRGLNGSTIMSDRIEELLAKQGLIRVPAFYNNGNPTKTWYHGRPVMITQNSYSKGLFNGDTGITLIDETGQVNVWFPDTNATEEGAYKSLSPVRLPAHETTWAMTIHKSQGSEFDEVALILPHEVMPLLTRQLIYTGVTRAREKVSIVASEKVLQAGVKTNVMRATRIRDSLKTSL
jgi:exodeoxyribonuclease V alpha subunit